VCFVSDDFEFQKDDPDPGIEDVRRFLEVDMRGLDAELDELYSEVARNYESFLKASDEDRQEYFEERALDAYMSFSHAYGLDKGGDF